MGQKSELANTYWKGVPIEDSTFSNDSTILYRVYSQESVCIINVFPDSLGGIEITSSIYGFSDSCSIRNAIDLKDNGINYFELDSSDFDDLLSSNKNLQEQAKNYIELNCCQLYFDNQKDYLYLTIYKPSRQQYALFQKLNKLPNSIEQVIRLKYPRIYFQYISSCKH